RYLTSVANKASRRRPIIAGDSDTLPTRSIPIADAASWSSRSIASRGWWRSCSCTRRCSRTSQKKVVSPDQQRAAADYLDEKYGVSQRRISRVMGRSRSGLRYRRRRRAEEPALNKEIKRLARR